MVLFGGGVLLWICHLALLGKLRYGKPALSFYKKTVARALYSGVWLVHSVWRARFKRACLDRWRLLHQYYDLDQRLRAPAFAARDRAANAPLCGQREKREASNDIKEEKTVCKMHTQSLFWLSKMIDCNKIDKFSSNLLYI